MTGLRRLGRKGRDFFIMETIEKRTLDNGMVLTVSDLSRKVAGDRWQVRLVWEAACPVTENFFPRLRQADQALLAAVRGSLGESMTFTLTRERNFVADSDKAALVAALLKDGLANMLDYLNTPGFPAKLFSRRYEEARKACLLLSHYDNGNDETDNDGEPADFSACFRDP